MTGARPRPEPAPRGRQAEAARNDAGVLAAALDVLATDPAAPMSAVAARAGVGQASLYRRYPSRDALLATVCEDEMTRIRDAARAAAAAAEGDAAWGAFAGFLRWYVASGTGRLAALLGSFVPPPALFALAREGNDALQALVDRTVAAGRLRADVTGADLTLLVTQVVAIEAGDPARTAAWRERALALALQALALTDAPALPGPAPDAAALEAPWRATAEG